VLWFLKKFWFGQHIRSHLWRGLRGGHWWCWDAWCRSRVGEAQFPKCKGTGPKVTDINRWFSTKLGRKMVLLCIDGAPIHIWLKKKKTEWIWLWRKKKIFKNGSFEWYEQICMLSLIENESVCVQWFTNSTGNLTQAIGSPKLQGHAKELHPNKLYVISSFLLFVQNIVNSMISSSC
jgi:hypothetical protein